MRLNHEQAVKAIAELEPFVTNTGTLRGVTDMAEVTRGEMGGTWFDCMMFDCPEYVVMSFATPIAWTYDPEYDDERWISKTFYSVTTAAHQELVRRAWKETTT